MLQCLLVETDPDVAEVLKEGIESSGDAAVTWASTGSTATQILGTEEFDIAVIETLLPDISGFEVARRAANGNVAVLLMSGHPAQQELCRVHTFPLLEKPFRPTALIASITEIMRRTRHNIFRVQQSCYSLDVTVAHSKLLALKAAWLREESAALRTQCVTLRTECLALRTECVTKRNRQEHTVAATTLRYGGTAATGPDVADRMIGMLFHTTTALIHRDTVDLSARQIATFLICYLDEEAQTVRGLAVKLKVAKAVITRVLDRLSQLDLVRRKTDPLDRRSILVQRTTKGKAFLRDVKTMLVDGDREFSKRPAVC
jgi:DNA-binding response OmpR family regulator/DNA-binding MarR family transcriptional regulator